MIAEVLNDDHSNFSKATIKWGDLDLFLVYFMISYLTAATQPLGTHNILHCVITLVSSLFKPVNMRSCNFKNGVTWSYSRANEVFEHQKLDQMIFQQPEHSICIKKYSYRS